MKRLSLVPVLIWLAWAVPAQSQDLSLEQIMADPDWIGRAPGQAWWADDSQAVYFQQKRAGSEQEDVFRLTLDGAGPELISADAYATIDFAGEVFSADGRLKAWQRQGDIYVKDLAGGQVRQLTRTAAREEATGFSVDGTKLFFRRDDTLLLRDLESGLEYQAAEIIFEDPPASATGEDVGEQEDAEDTTFLERREQRLFQIIALQQQRQRAAEEFEREQRRDDGGRLDLPWYPGADLELVTSALSPGERWLLTVMRNTTEREAGREGSMPNYVTSSGYVENTEVRARVGTTTFAEQRLHLFDLEQHRYAELDLSALPGRDENPLPVAEEAGGEAASGTATEGPDEPARKTRITDIRWSADGSKVLFNALSRDNKDRWLLSLDTGGLSLSPPLEGDDESGDAALMAPLALDAGAIDVLHHHHDPAWINNDFIAADWLPDNQSVWFLSEADGYGHLYLHDGTDARALTGGEFEVHEPTLSRAGDWIYFAANREHPTFFEIHRVGTATGNVERLTDLGGLNRYLLSPDESKLLLIHSEALHPPELYVQESRPGAPATRLTHTTSAAFLAANWSAPEFVEVPSSRVNRPIHSRVYTPDEDADEPAPAVVFIHGAGYLQNAHRGWSGYFREFMFHSFLTQQGYVVLDMDYRASAGYGRDWRTAIYRQMGTPEVQDLADGVDWLVRNRNVDRDRVCAYGGSYGGFLTLMALFTEPQLFACGAALRPVTDWAHYNHGYTSNILNVPELDPDAYRQSSPIDFAEGLQKPLLIAHGMQDDNVFFQDSVRLVQRLIELEKEDWEMAIYPIEAHGFREPSSWLDEYRRIFKLVEETLRP